MEQSNERLTITGVPVDNITTVAAVLEFIDAYLKSPPRDMLQVVFINAHVVNVASAQPSFKELLWRNRLNLPDGIGIWLAGKILYRKNLSNLNGTDFGIDLLKWLAQQGYRVFFLGAREGVAARAKTNLEKMIPGLQVVGYHHGYFEPHATGPVIDYINRSGAEILFICMGVPQQEFWLDLNRHNCPEIKLACALGAFFDFYSGTIKRAPLFIRKLRMEWVYRLVQEPGRLWKRYLIGNVRFMLQVVLNVTKGA